MTNNIQQTSSSTGRKGCGHWLIGCLTSAVAYFVVSIVFLAGLIASLIAGLTEKNALAFLEWFGGTLGVCALIILGAILPARRAFRKGNQLFDQAIDEKQNPRH